MTTTLPAAQHVAAERCASCPKMCRGVCPTHEVTRNERHQPWGHAREDVAAERSSGVAGAGFAAEAVAESAFLCATCAACTVPCEVEGVETPDLVWAVRAAVWEAGAAPAAAVEAAAHAAAGLVLAADDPPRWVDPSETVGALAASSTPAAPLLLVPGCGALGRRPGAVRAAGQALAALGAPFRVGTPHVCCGAVARAAGDDVGARAAAAALLDGAREAGVETIAVQSPSCAVHLHREGGTAVVVPLARLLGELARSTERTTADAPARQAVAYHDPCMLARHLGAVDEPRSALRAAGHEVVELARTGPATRCSGRGGLLSLTNPRVAAGYLDLLASEVRATGAARVVTGCATCAAALEGALAGVVVEELAEAVAQAFASRGDA